MRPRCLCQWALSSAEMSSARDSRDLSSLKQEIRSCGYGGDRRLLTNLLVEMYGRLRSVKSAERAFGAIEEPNVYSWTILLGAYAQNGHLEDAEATFLHMPQRSLVTWNSMLRAYAERGRMDSASRTARAQPVVVDDTAQGYAQVGHLEQAKFIFDSVPFRDLICFKTLLSAYSQQGYLDETTSIFCRMPVASAVTWNCVLLAYAQSGHVHQAREVFSAVPEKSIVSCTTMLQAHAQNGHLVEADRMHRLLLEHDCVSWSCMISAHAHFGRGQDAIDHFHAMVSTGFHPSKVTLLSLLIAWSHAGRLERSWQQFVRMTVDFSVLPQSEHYCCMVDILGRAGHQAEARELLLSMPFEPTPTARSAMLASLSFHTLDQRNSGKEHARELSRTRDVVSSLGLLQSQLRFANFFEAGKTS